MKLPNSPQSPSFLQAFQWATRPSDFLNNCTKHCGEIFRTNFPGPALTIFISNPKAIEQIFTIPREVLNSGEGNRIFQPVLGQNSLMLLDSKPHKESRKLLTPPFHGERIQVYARLIYDLTEKILSQWKVGEVFKVRSCIQEISLGVVLRAVFGLSEGERLERLREKFLVMLEMVASPIFFLHLVAKPLQQDWGTWNLWGQFLRLRNEIDELLYAEIAQRRKQHLSERTDILALLMAAHDEDGKPMSDKELRDQLITLLITGQDTTVTSITWALYCIHRTPKVREKLLEELNSVSDSSDINTISKLPYLAATCHETLRMYSPVVVGFPRIIKTSCEIMGYKFPAGTHLIPNIYSAHHRKETFLEAEKFKPERFLENKFSPYEYFPFGGGNRRCIGYALGQYQMKLVLAIILLRYRLLLMNQNPIYPVRRAGGLAPAKEIYMMIES
ncbi:cytochrome P450 [Calothrix parasitica NIES-267]|uniref:Cytochrome P450 n=1 Tax=Calothrix parasitica NIES-267 TaxID=1973488 RepID=A0A1Z4LHI2_9CYAN|nr:cytochrome P450 [Calothrix parasitica NIES-267]